MDSDQKNSNKLLNGGGEFNRTGQDPSNPKGNSDKEFLSNYQVEEIEPDMFEILFDLDTREAGAHYVIIDTTHICIVCDEYEIRLKHKGNFMDLKQKVMYALLKQEDNPRIIRQILKHLEKLGPIMDSIFYYFSKQRIEK